MVSMILFLSLILSAKLIEAQSNNPIQDWNLLISNSQVTTSQQESQQQMESKFLGWPQNNSFLNCNQLVINDYSINFSFNCSLVQKPSSDVYIFLEAYGVTFSKCYLHFTPQSTSQSVLVQPLSNVDSANAVNNVTIFMLADAPTELFHNQTKVIVAPKTTTPSNVLAFNIGDPHLVSFGGFGPVGVQIPGDFFLIESQKGLRVQARYSSCVGAVMCISAISIQYHDSWFLLSGSALPIKQSPTTNGITYKMIGLTSQFNMDDGSIITISPVAPPGQGWVGFLNFNINALAGIHYQNVGGHLNHWDNNLPASSFVHRDGSTITTLASKYYYPTDPQSAFFLSWAVQPQENCLNGVCVQPVGTNPSPITTCPQFCQINDIPIPLLPRVSQIEIIIIDRYDTPFLISQFIILIEIVYDSPSIYTIPVFVCEITYSNATNLCLSAASSFPSNNSLSIMPCVNDMIQMCDTNVVSQYSTLWKSQDIVLANSLCQSNLVDSRVAGNVVLITFGVGNNTCPNNCSGQGTCSSSGCLCQTGFTGLACDTNLQIGPDSTPTLSCETPGPIVDNANQYQASQTNVNQYQASQTNASSVGYESSTIQSTMSYESSTMMPSFTPISNVNIAYGQHSSAQKPVILSILMVCLVVLVF